MKADEVFQVIATSLVQASDEGWEKLEAVCPILHKGLGGVETRQFVNGAVRDLPIGFAIFDLQRACIALRDELIATGDDRIWGLTFTLYPTGEFDVKYDYRKPSDYDETDEVITGEEINQSLASVEAAAPAMSVEDAYRSIAYCVMDAQGDSAWDRGGVELEYKLGRQALMNFWQERGDRREKAPAVPEHAVMVSAVDAAYALYDDLGRDGGAVPAGLSFSLTSAGKMKLDYRYS